MQRRLVIVLMLVATVLSLSSTAEAHSRNVSTSTWTWRDNQAQVQFRLPQTGVAQLVVGIGLEKGSIGPRELRQMRQLARERVVEGVEVSQGKATCEAKITNGPARVVGQSLVVTGSYQCPKDVSKAGVRARVDLLPKLGMGHTHLARMKITGQSAAEHKASLSPLQRELVIAGGEQQTATATWATFIKSGVSHILVGYDHLAFLFMLVLVVWYSARRDEPASRAMVRPLLWTATAFTIGHSVTLALAVTGVMRPPGATIELLIALSILVVALEGVVVAVGSKTNQTKLRAALALVLLSLPAAALCGLLEHSVWALLGLALLSLGYLEGVVRDRVSPAAQTTAPWAPNAWRASVALLFGLVHGFGFAGVLLDANLSGSDLLMPLLSFNLGVELGQLTLILVLGWLLWQLKRVGRPQLMLRLGTMATVGLACYWVGARLL